MSRKPPSQPLWWAWSRSLGRTRYLWRCALEGLERGALIYLTVYVCENLFHFRSSSTLFANARGVVAWLVISALISLVRGFFNWDYYELKYRPTPPGNENCRAPSRPLSGS